MPLAEGTFEPSHWEEHTVHEVDDGPKLTRADVQNRYAGDLAADATLTYLMVYLGEEGSFAGFEQVTGRLGGHEGGFVVRHDGTFAHDMIRGTLSVVPGSGTAGLAGIEGSGSFAVRTGERAAPYRFEYRLP